MARKFGREAIEARMALSLDYSRDLMRAQIERIPRRRHEGSDFIEPVQASGWPKESHSGQG